MAALMGLESTLDIVASVISPKQDNLLKLLIEKLRDKVVINRNPI